MGDFIPSLIPTQNMLIAHKLEDKFGISRRTAERSIFVIV